MEIIAWLLFEVLLLILILAAWIILLPVGVLVATPVILIMSALQKKPARQLFGNFVQWWTDIIPSCPDFKRNKKNIEQIK